MDEFGILTAGYGLKPQGKSTPMAASRRPNNHHHTSNITTDTSNRDRYDDFGTFCSPNTTKSQSFGNYGNVFGGFENNSSLQSSKGGDSFNFDSMHKNLNDFGLRSSSMPHQNNVYGFEDDIFGGMPGLNVSSSSTVKNDNDVFAQFASASTQRDGSIDDLLGNIGGSKVKSNVAVGSKSNGFDDLIPGFGGRSPLINGITEKLVPPAHLPSISLRTTHDGSMSKSHKKKLETKSTSTLLEDPFAVFSTPETTSGVLSDALEKLGNLSSAGRTHASATNGTMHESIDPFDVFVNTPSRAEKSESSKIIDDAQTSIPKIPPFKHSVNGKAPLRPPIKPSQASRGVKSSGVSSVDELEEFAKGKVRNISSPSATPLKDATERFEEKFKLAKESRERNTNVTREKGSPETSKYNRNTSGDDLDPIFSANFRSRSAPRSSRASSTESMVDTQFHSGEGTKVGQTTPSSMRKAPSAANILDDISSIFGDDQPGKKFEEVQGESDERRKARFERHIRTNERMAAAMADMNQRDLQIQREQEERQKISESLDGEIKRWAAGKEGNLRALLSSLQLILWADCGWKAVSLTDMITSTSVKKVFNKANLYVHPDKVQQKGANLEQKYVAEKVFNILQEAWNKFRQEELS